MPDGVVKSGLDALDLPWLTHNPKDGRIIPTAVCYWDPERGFRTSLEGKRGFVELPSSPVNGTYLSTNGPAEEKWSWPDPLGTLIFQRASFPKALEALYKTHSDQLNLAASLEKHRLILRECLLNDRPEAMQALLRTEFEYLFVTVRTLFDQLQFLVRSVVRVSRQGSPQLPQSFYQLSKLRPREIEDKYHLSPSLCSWYGAYADYFEIIRNTRVKVEHHGFTPPLVIFTSGGFAVNTGEKPWSNIPIWEGHTSDGEIPLGSLFRALAWVVGKALLVADDLASALEDGGLTQSPPISDWDAYLSSPLVSHFFSLDTYFEDLWDPDAEGVKTAMEPLEWPSDW